MFFEGMQKFTKATGALKNQEKITIGQYLTYNTVTSYFMPLMPGESDSVKLTFRILYHHTGDFARFFDHDIYIDHDSVFFDAVKTKAIINQLHIGKAKTPTKKSAQENYPDASQSFSNLQILIDSLELGELVGIDSGSTVINFDLGSAIPYIHMVPDGDSLPDAIYAKQSDFYTGDPANSTFHLPTNYQLLIPDYTDSAVVILKCDWQQKAQDQSKVDFYIANAVYNGETYNIDLAGTNTDVANGLKFGDVSDYASVPPGTYTLEIRNTNGDLVASSDIDLSNDAGRSLTMIIAPNDSSTANGMAIKIFGASSADSIWTLESESAVTSIDQATAGQKVYLSYRYTDPITIDFTLPEAGQATIKVYDLNGRELRTLVNRFYNSGSYSVSFNTSGLPAGIYFFRLVTNGVEISNKIIIRR